jgi:uncharacterized protein (TIGR02453 family)
MAFQGIPPQGYEFLMQIRFNNNREWFAEHKETFEQCLKMPLHALAAELAPLAGKMDEDIDTRPARVVSRIYRDARRCKGDFYRDTLWLDFRKAGLSASEAFSFYFYITPEEYGWGCGFWGAPLPLMKAFRAKMLREQERFLEILSGDWYKEYDFVPDLYAKPKKIEIDEQLRPWYNCRTFYLEHVRPLDALAFSPDLAETLKTAMRDAIPFYQFVVEG